MEGWPQTGGETGHPPEAREYVDTDARSFNLAKARGGDSLLIVYISSVIYKAKSATEQRRRK